MVQQVISIQTRQVKSAAPPALNRAQTFLQYDSTDSSLPGATLPTSEMIGAALEGVFFESASSRETYLDMNPLCATGNCTFPSFQSLALCSSCEDVTQALNRSCERDEIQLITDSQPHVETIYCQLSLPNGLKLNQTDEDGSDARVATSGYLGSVMPTEYGNTVLNFTRIKSLAGEEGRDVNATQCVLYWCVNTYEARVSNGQLDERITDSWYSATTEWWSTRDIMNSLRIDIAPALLTSGSNNPNFTVAWLATNPLSEWLAEKLTVSNSFAPSVSEDGQYGFGLDDAANGTLDSTVDTLRVFRDSNVTTVFSNLAKSMTRNTRNVNWTVQTYGDNFIGPFPGVGTVNGTATYLDVQVSVRWVWLAFPAALIVLTMLFLAMTMINTAHIELAVWKSSPLPLLFHGLEETETERLRMTKKMVEMEKFAHQIQVQLKDTGTGLGLAR